MGFKHHIISIFRDIGTGATFGYIFNYFRAYGLELPTTTQQLAESLGMAGLISGIIGGFCGVFFPQIFTPYIMKMPIVKRALDRLRGLIKRA